MRDPQPRVALATYATLPALAEEERPLIPALDRLGVQAEAVVWSEPATAWGGYDAVVIRSVWDYHERLAEFLGWIERLEREGVRIWNPPDVIRWNSDKRYLRDVEARGVPIVPTHWVKSDHVSSLGALLDERGWSTAVVKPAVSAGARNTWRTSRASADTDDERFRALAQLGPLMVQPFLEEIQRDGEWSFIFFGGALSHAVLKRPAAGDFRVQEHHGGVATSLHPPSALREQAEAALDAVNEPCLYARIDGCVVEDEFQVMELELLEPSLFMEHVPGAYDSFARAIADAIG